MSVASRSMAAEAEGANLDHRERCRLDNAQDRWPRCRAFLDIVENHPALRRSPYSHRWYRSVAAFRTPRSARQVCYRDMRNNTRPNHHAVDDVRMRTTMDRGGKRRWRPLRVRGRLRSKEPASSSGVVRQEANRC